MMEIDKLENKELLKFSKKCYKIPHISKAIADYMKTEKGKQALLDYIIEHDDFNYELINEIKNYGNN